MADKNLKQNNSRYIPTNNKTVYNINESINYLIM